MSIFIVLILFQVIRLIAQASGNEPKDQTYAAPVSTESPTTYDPVTIQKPSKAIIKLDEVAGIEDTYISSEAYKACMKYGTQYSVQPELLMAMIERESAGDPKALNGDCTGLMQVSAYWHADRMKKLGCTDLYDSTQNIHVGTDYIAELLDRYTDPYLALMMYNMEHDTAMELYKSGEFTSYATGIVDRSNDLLLLHKYNNQ